MSPSAEVCLPAAKHQNTAVARLLQVLITQSAGSHTSVCLLKIKLLGASSMPLLGVVALDKGTTIACEPRLMAGGNALLWESSPKRQGAAFASRWCGEKSTWGSEITSLG
jgi:hypothetical protein